MTLINHLTQKTSNFILQKIIFDKKVNLENWTKEGKK